VPAPDSEHSHIVEYPEAVITNHVCPCINLQDAVWWHEADGRLRLLPIDARGRLF
jgi:hypothetical protein